MRILVISNLGPVPGNPLGGVFLPPRLDGLVAAGNHVTLVLPVVSTASTTLVNRLRSKQRQPGPGLAVSTQPSVGKTPWNRVPVHLPEWQRWTGIAGFPEALADTIANRVLAHVERDRFDLVQAHGMYEFWAGGVARAAAHSLGTPYAVTLHGSDVNLLPRWKRPAFRRVAQDAAGLLFVSEALQRNARALGLVPGRSGVTPNGVDVSVFHPTGRTGSRGLRTLFVGSLSPVKGADRLPDVLRSIQGHEPSARLKIIGEGPMRSKLQHDLTGTSTTFLGRVSPAGVAEHLRESDVVLIPSRNEGWSCVAMEAQACGTRVVATDVGGLPESVGPGGELVSQSPFEGELFALAVLRQWRRTDAEAISRRSQDFDWRVLGERESSLLQSFAT